MEYKTTSSTLYLYKETRADLEPLQPNSIIQIQVPSTSTFSTRSRQQRRVLKKSPTCPDEDSFVRVCLATHGSLYFSKHKKYPRSFLWRVVQDGTILELRSLDLSKNEGETREATIIVQLCFPSAIKRGGVVLADVEDQNGLNVFALTKGNEIYTFTLHKDFFCNISATEEDVRKWCKTFKPATFSISTPYSMICGSPSEIIVSLSDGRLLRLTKRTEDDGSQWCESTYGDGQWGSSLRGLVRWQGSNTIKYDGTTLEQGTPIAMALSPDKNHIFAVCLNHTLRIWNPNKASSVFSKDLLWRSREPHEIPRMMLDPGNPNVLQLFQTNTVSDGYHYYVVTFSPHDFGQFKFWGIRDPDYGDKGVCDLFPELTFKPPDPDPSPESKAIWKVVDFKVKSARRDSELEMWVLMRSNRQYQLYNLKFEIESLSNIWQGHWSAVASETMSEYQSLRLSDLDPEDSTDKWLDFIFRPGRYPETVIKAAVAVYSSERSVPASKHMTTLKEKACSAIAHQVKSLGVEDGFSRMRKANCQEWSVLGQVIRDIDRMRWDCLSLVYDSYAEMPWLVFADGCSAIRTCDRIETVTQNIPANLSNNPSMIETPSIETDSGNEPKFPDELATIISAAATFRQSFSYSLTQSIASVTAEELWLDASYSGPLRIQSFYDRCNFKVEIADEPFNVLCSTLDRIRDSRKIDSDSFLTILNDFSHNLPLEGSGLLHTNIGRKFLINGAKEMIDMRERIISDLLILVVVLEIESEGEDIPMEDIDAPRIYVALLHLLKRYKIMQWLAQNVRPETTKSQSISSTGNSVRDKSSVQDESAISSVLENIFALDLRAQSNDDQSSSEALTSSIQDLLQWAIGGNEAHSVDEMAAYVQANLLASANIELATDFLQYQPATAWATYLKGRLCLSQREFTEAAVYFQKAAFQLARSSDFDYYAASHGLLSPMEALSFGNGLPTYYTHILNLFDASSQPTQMAHFAHLALQLTPATPANHDQTFTLLTSLFQASLQTTDFSTAYSALTRHPSPETLLPSFIQSILTTPKALPQLLSLPFPPSLHSQIDNLLSTSKTPPKVLAAWRLKHNNFRGAAAALLPPLQQAQTKLKPDKKNGLEEDYLTVINLLACAGEENGWVLSEGAAASKGRVGGKIMDGGGSKAKRKVVTIGDVRGKYQKELDRRDIIDAGRFDFGGIGDGEGEGEEADYP